MLSIHWGAWSVSLGPNPIASALVISASEGLYKPHTGKCVKTKGGNHKTLKEWKAEHGSATVESWLTK
jgi:hypothetical protein